MTTQKNAGITTPDTMSDELLNTYSAWDKYVSHLWYLFFNFCEIQPNDTIIEIAPGASPKIAMALRKLFFEGDVFIVEAYDDALQRVTDLYKAHLPKATIHPLKMTLIESLNYLPATPKCVVSHHALDDMIIATDFHAAEFSIFDWTKSDKLLVSDHFEKRWQQLSSDRENLTIIQDTIVHHWKSLLKKIDPEFLILSQYPSLVLNNHNESMASLNKTAQQLLQQIKIQLREYLESDDPVQSLLNANKNYNFPLLSQEVLHAKNWMIYHRKK